MFTVGYFYRHTTGLTLYIAGMAHTKTWGNCLVAEYPDGTLTPVGRGADSSQNWEKVSSFDWMVGRSPAPGSVPAIVGVHPPSPPPEPEQG